MRLSARIYLLGHLVLLGSIVGTGCGPGVVQSAKQTFGTVGGKVGSTHIPADGKPVDPPSTRDKDETSVAPGTDKAPTAPVEIKPISLSEYDKTIQQNKGKVVLVDFWFFGCVPCKEGFPHLAELQNKHGKEGLVVLTVNVDGPDQKGERAKTTQFLNEQKTPFTNLVLAAKEEPDDWFKKHDLGAFPTKFLYDREGKLVKRIEGLEDQGLDKMIEDLLKQK